MLIAAIDAAVTDKLAKVGERTSTKLNPDSSLADLGTIIDDPASTVPEPLPNKPSVGLIVLPFGKMINVFFSEAFII